MISLYNIQYANLLESTVHLLTSSSGLKAFAIKLLGRFVLDTGNSLPFYRHNDTEQLQHVFEKTVQNNITIYYSVG